MMRRLIGQILQKMGYTILLAENGAKGYSLAQSAGPDLVIMDIEMPVMNGIESAKMIKNDPLTAHIPVIFFTSLGSEEDIRRARESGGLDFLNKPVCREELQKTITAVWQ